MEIADWLRGLSLERYVETFSDNAIDVGGAAEHLVEPVPASAPIPRSRTDPAAKGP